MSYLPTVLLAAIGVLLLAALLIRTLGVVRAFTRTSRSVRAGFADHTGMLKARSAALRVAIKDRGNPPEGSATNPRSINEQGRQEDHRG